MGKKGLTSAQAFASSSDQPVYSLKCDDLTIEGYSRACVQTFWRIPEMKLGFDLGWQPWEYMGTPRWFLSHTHMDHSLALPAYVVRRRMMRMTPPDIYLPAEKVQAVQSLLDAFSKVDGGPLPCRLIGVAPGMEIELSRELVVSVVKAYHSVPSCGYMIWERRRKLRPEYASLTGEQIRDLRERGTSITYEIRMPRVAYVGDSTARILDQNPVMYEADVLITEVSFFTSDPSPDEARAFGHIHFDDILARRDRFQNKVVIAGHFTTRTTDQMILNVVHRKCPDLFDGRLHLWFGQKNFSPEKKEG